MSTTFLIQFLSIAGALSVFPVQEKPEKPCAARVEHTENKNMNVFEGYFKNHLDAPVDGEYTLETIKTGKSGRSVSRQAGEFTALGKQEVKLSKVSQNLAEGDSCTIVLKVYSGNLFICGDSLSFGQRNN